MVAEVVRLRSLPEPPNSHEFGYENASQRCLTGQSPNPSRKPEFRTPRRRCNRELVRGGADERLVAIRGRRDRFSAVTRLASACRLGFRRRATFAASSRRTFATRFRPQFVTAQAAIAVLVESPAVPPPRWRSRRLKVRRPHPCPTPRSPDFAVVLRPPHDLHRDRGPPGFRGGAGSCRCPLASPAPPCWPRPRGGWASVQPANSMIAKAPAKIVLHHLIVILPFAREVFFLEFHDPPAAVTLIQNRKMHLNSAGGGGGKRFPR